MPRMPGLTALRALVQSEQQKWASFVKQTGIKVEQ